MTVNLRARLVDKPWGHEEVFAETPNYVGKILFIRKGEALSLQYHEQKDEAFLVQVGRDPQSLESHLLDRGAVFHVTPGTLHRMIAVSDCSLLEVSTNHLDDVVRLEDRYGRQGTSAP